MSRAVALGLGAALSLAVGLAPRVGHAVDNKNDGQRVDGGAGAVHSCRRLPAGRRMVKLNLKPETDIGDLVLWISSITCKPFLLPGTVPSNSHKVTIVAPQLISSDDAYRLFLAALDSVGLAVYPMGRFMRIVDVQHAKSSPLPLYGFPPPQTASPPPASSPPPAAPSKPPASSPPPAEPVAPAEPSGPAAPAASRSADNSAT